MESRRSFFGKAIAGLSALSISGLSASAKAAKLSDTLVQLRKKSILEVSVDEDIWYNIRQAYTVSPNIINLNNGGVSPQPKVVQDAVDRYYHLSNEAPSYYMWRTLNRGKETVREKLALLAGVDPETIAVNRNTTEALDTVIFGIRLEKGDEVILTKQDYPNMINAWKQREAREGIKLKWLNLNMPESDNRVILDAFKNATTNKTKVWHITHIINWNGQILPAKELCREARQRGILSLVDGAHSFAHIPFTLSELDCDFFGTSLHKWLCAPFGTGMLYMKREHIQNTWPLIPDHRPNSADIRKFESLGTRSFAPEQAISHAIDFHNGIGIERKTERLQYLKTYWVNRVKDHPKIQINSPVDKEHSRAICLVNIEGMSPSELSNKLMKDYRLHTTAVVWENISGVRITPHVYTLSSDLDMLVNALLSIADA